MLLLSPFPISCILCHGYHGIVLNLLCLGMVTGKNQDKTDISAVEHQGEFHLS